MAIGGAAGLAYTGIDESIDRWHARRVRRPATDAAAGFLHLFGQRFWVLYWGLFAVADARWCSSPLTRWGRRSFEALLVGLPSLWAAQWGLGSARPSDRTHGPRFHPFADDNGASGHTFIAAIPCLVAARMCTRRPSRTLAYALSPLTGWSRLNDRKHYLSQVALGYALAWQAVASVMEGKPRPGAQPAPQSAPRPDPLAAAPSDGDHLARQQVVAAEAR